MATWSHPSTRLSINGTKLSNIRGSTHISCRVVIISFQNCWNIRHSNRVCQVSSFSTLFYHHWRIQGSPLVSYRIGTHWPPHGWTLPGLGRNSSIHGLFPTMPRGCVLTGGSILLSNFQGTVSVMCLSSYMIYSFFPLPGLIWHVVLYTLLLYSSTTILIESTLVSTQTASMEIVR